MNMQKLSDLDYNEIVLLDRVELNLLESELTKIDERTKLARKIITRTLVAESKSNKPCMTVPVRVWELKILFPDYETREPRWCKRHK